MPGVWMTEKAIAFGETELDPKTKSLISLAVAAQIPCQYCIQMDTEMARMHGATDAEIAEAVAVAANTRAWSTVFYGTQVDLETFKAELAALGN